MAQSTPATPSLGTTVLARIGPVCDAATRQRRVGRRLVLLTVGLLLVSGRTMLSRVLLVLGLATDDWSAAYRVFAGGRVDLEVLRRGVVARWLALQRPHTPLVTVLDGTQLPPHAGSRVAACPAESGLAARHPSRPAVGGSERPDPDRTRRRQPGHPVVV